MHQNALQRAVCVRDAVGRVHSEVLKVLKVLRVLRVLKGAQ
jgi:hypothetical protein